MRRMFRDNLRGPSFLRALIDQQNKMARLLNGFETFGLRHEARPDGLKLFAGEEEGTELYEFQCLNLDVSSTPKTVEVRNGHWDLTLGGFQYAGDYGTGDLNDTTSITLTAGSSGEVTVIAAKLSPVLLDDDYDAVYARSASGWKYTLEVKEIKYTDAAPSFGQGARQTAIDAEKEAADFGAGPRDADYICLARIEWTSATEATLIQEYEGGSLQFFSRHLPPFYPVAITRSTDSPYGATVYYTGGSAYIWNAKSDGKYTYGITGGSFAVADSDDILVVAELSGTRPRTEPTGLTIDTGTYTGADFTTLDSRYQRALFRVQNDQGIITVNMYCGGAHLEMGCVLQDEYALESNDDITDSPTELRLTLRGMVSHTTAEDGDNANLGSETPSTAGSDDFFAVGRQQAGEGERKKLYWYSWSDFESQLDGLYSSVDGWWEDYASVLEANQAMLHGELSDINDQTVGDDHRGNRSAASSILEGGVNGHPYIHANGDATRNAMPGVIGDSAAFTSIDPDGRALHEPAGVSIVEWSSTGLNVLNPGDYYHEGNQGQSITNWTGGGILTGGSIIEIDASDLRPTDKILVYRP